MVRTVFKYLASLVSRRQPDNKLWAYYQSQGASPRNCGPAVTSMAIWYFFNQKKTTPLGIRSKHGGPNFWTLGKIDSVLEREGVRVSFKDINGYSPRVRESIGIFRIDKSHFIIAYEVSDGWVVIDPLGATPLYRISNSQFVSRVDPQFLLVRRVTVGQW